MTRIFPGQWVKLLFSLLSIIGCYIAYSTVLYDSCGTGTVPDRRNGGADGKTIIDRWKEKSHFFLFPFSSFPHSTNRGELA